MVVDYAPLDIEKLLLSFFIPSSYYDENFLSLIFELYTSHEKKLKQEYHIYKNRSRIDIFVRILTPY
jgi:hypothetical protein